MLELFEEEEIVDVLSEVRGVTARLTGEEGRRRNAIAGLAISKSLGADV